MPMSKAEIADFLNEFESEDGTFQELQELARSGRIKSLVVCAHIEAEPDDSDQNQEVLFADFGLAGNPDETESMVHSLQSCLNDIPSDLG